VLLFLSINFVMLPFGSISEAMLRRKLAFDKLAIITITSSFAGMAVGIGSAWLGAGYLAIVWATNVSTLVTILLTLWYRPPGLPWRPGLGAFREVSGFGLKVGFLDLVMRGGDSATELMIGKVHGLADLGMYSRAYGAYSLFEYAFIEGIRPVVLPFLSEARRNESAVQPLYLQIVAFVSVFMTPFFAFLMVNADDVIRVLYGDQWQAAVPVLQVMCIAGLFLAPTVYFDQLLIAHSRPGLALRYQMLFQAARIGALALLLGDQLALAAVALVVGSVVKLGTAVVLARRLFEVQTASLLGTMLPALAIGALALPALWFCSDAIQHWNSAFLRLLVCGSLFGAIWLGGIYLFRHPVTLEINKLVSRLKPA
jgi:O-antigen/teichoic acid export membrane protein